MNNVTPYFKGVLRHHFWVLCGVIAPVLMGGWFTTTARMRGEKDDRIDKINSRYTEVDKLRKEVDHPNAATTAKMNALIDGLQQEIYGAWDQQYQRQLEILKWPAQLGDEFIDQVKDYRPTETFIYERVPNPKTELLPKYREQYRNYIKKELPKLAEIVQAEWTAGGPGAAPASSGLGDFGAYDSGNPTDGAGPPAEEPENNRFVSWDNADQSSQSRRFDWSTTSDKRPRTVDILYAQEDLWVLTALMKIIANANSDATGKYNATVREIMSIQLGSEVGGSSGSIGSGTGEEKASAWDAMWGAGEDDAGGGGGAGASAGMPGASARRTDPADNRYVDTEYNPIPGEELREIVNSDKKAEPEKANLLVAKRIPVRLKLRLDSRRINRFIAACGNSELMVEVRQVRINPAGMDGSGGIGGGDDAMMMMGMEVQTDDPNDDQSSGFEALGGGPGGPGAAVDLTAVGLAEMEIEEEDPEYILPVEFFGMVYIYNPVNTERLAIENLVTEETVETVDPPAATADEADPPAAADDAAPDGTEESAAPDTDAGAAPATTDADAGT